MSSFGFLVGSFLEQEKHYHALHDCISSIRQFHEEPIVVIFNTRSEKEYVGKIMETFQTNMIYELENPEEIPGDMLIYKYFKENHYFDIAITLQDSMRILKKIDPTVVETVKYLWHFTNHRVHWSSIEEPQTEYNITHGIRTHDDLILHYIRTYNTCPGFIQYCNNIYSNKDRWVGCFGFMTIMRHSFLCLLDDMTGITDLMLLTNTNRLRRVMESIFALACQYTLGYEIKDSFDGLYYDGHYHNGFTGNIIAKKSFDRH
jgi:hypothetical protein